MSDYDFIALDVETANEEYWSICQVGLAYFKNDQVVDTWKTYVNPETEFNEINIDIHGIDEDMVKGAIKLPEMYQQLNKRISGNIVAHHMPFDRGALSQCAAHVSADPIDCRWLDTARVSRRVWEDVSQRGYGLSNLSTKLQISFDRPHDALCDAIAAGMVLNKALHQSQLSLQEWLVKAYIKSEKSDKELRELANSDPNPDGPLFGEVVVFTGALSITRLEAAKMAYQMGCNIDVGVNRNTTLLVIGDQDLRVLKGYTKSSKHRKAEELIAAGQPIRIIGENDFMSMISY